MKLTSAELAEIRSAFRHRIASEHAPKKTARPTPAPKPESPFARRPDYADDAVLTPAQTAELFAVTPRTVRRWADVGLLPSFRALSGQRRFRWDELRRAIREL